MFMLAIFRQSTSRTFALDMSDCRHSFFQNILYEGCRIMVFGSFQFLVSLIYAENVETCPPAMLTHGWHLLSDNTNSFQILFVFTLVFMNISILMFVFIFKFVLLMYLFFVSFILCIGVMLGIVILKNVNTLTWEKALGWVTLAIYLAFVAFCCLFNALYEGYPPTDWTALA